MRRRASSGLPSALGTALVGLALLAAWHLLAAAGVWPRYLFPGPAEVAARMAQAWSQGELGTGVVRSMARMAAGFGLAVAMGVPLGLLLAAAPPALAGGLRAVFTGLQSLPSVCWFPLAILWLGLDERAILFITVAGSLFVVACAVDAGVRQIPPVYAQAAGTLGIRGWRLYAWVLLPAGVPALVVALRQGWSMAWRSLMAGELLYVSGGLGHLLQLGRELHDAPLVLGVVLVTLLLGLATERLLFLPAEQRVARRWGFSAART